MVLLSIAVSNGAAACSDIAKDPAEAIEKSELNTLKTLDLPSEAGIRDIKTECPTVSFDGFR